MGLIRTITAAPRRVATGGAEVARQAVGTVLAIPLRKIPEVAAAGSGGAAGAIVGAAVGGAVREVGPVNGTGLGAWFGAEYAVRALKLH